MKKIAYLIFMLMALCRVGIAQHADVEHKFFPEPDIKFNTPSFSGASENYKGIIDYLETLMKKNPGKATLSYIGKTQDGLAIPIVTFGNKANADKIKVMFTGGIHGDEPCGTEGLLVLIDSLLSYNKYDALLNNIDLEIIPVVNIDGYLKGKRKSSNKLDINRDFTKLETPEAQNVYKAFVSFGPDIFIDFHEFNPYRADFEKLEEAGVTSCFDAMLLYSGNLNVDEGIRNGCTSFLVKNIKGDLDNNKLRSFEYFKPDKTDGHMEFTLGSNSPRSTSTSFALNNSLAMLIEVRGVGLEAYSKKRRTLTTYVIAQSVLQTAYRSGMEIRNIVKKAKYASVTNHTDVIIKSTARHEQLNIPFIDINKVATTLISADVVNNLFQTKQAERALPKAYIINANFDSIRLILDDMGIKYLQVKKQMTVEAETYKITKQEDGNQKFEGLVEKIAQVTTQQEQVSLLAGALFIPVDQPKSNLLKELIEPDATNSWYRFRVIQQDANGIIPIYRYNKSNTF